MTTQQPITLAETGNVLDSVEIESLNLKVNALYKDEGYFGEKHWTGRRHDEIYIEMRQRHPGFGDEAYELALHRGIFAMR